MITKSPIHWVVGGLTIALLTPRGASADVVMPPNITCPPGSKPTPAHFGAYCAAENAPTNCPPGYEPKTFRDTAFCLAPRSTPCPQGTHWDSSGPNRGACFLDNRCLDNDKSPECVPFNYCAVRVPTGGIHSRDEILGECTSEKTCAELEKPPAAREAPRCVTYRTKPNPNQQEKEKKAIALAKTSPSAPPPQTFSPLSTSSPPPNNPTAPTNTSQSPSQAPSIPHKSDPVKPVGCFGCTQPRNNSAAPWVEVLALLGAIFYRRRLDFLRQTRVG